MRSNTEKLDQAERILKMAELTRKLDTEQESVVPFYASTLTPEEEEQVNFLLLPPPPLLSLSLSLVSFTKKRKKGRYAR